MIPAWAEHAWTPAEVGQIVEKVQAAAYQAGWDAAKAEYVPVLMEHLRILAELSVRVAALRPGVLWDPYQGGNPDVVLRADVLALISGGVNPPDPIFGHDHGQ